MCVAKKMSSVEIHIFVTSVPKGTKPVEVIVAENDDIGFWGVPREDAKVEKGVYAWCPTHQASV